MSSIKTVLTDSSGLGEISNQTNAADTGRTFTTLIALNDDAIVDQVQNLGVNVHQIKGDGRKWFPVLSSMSGTPVVGDVWLQQDTTLGTVMKIQTTSGTITIAASGVSGGGLQYTATTGLLIGMAVYIDPTNGPLYAATTVDGSHKYRVRGVVLATATTGNPVTILTDGDELTLSDWSLLAGATTLTQGATYWLTSTPGRYAATPGSGCSARVGWAANATTLVVQTGLTVTGTP